MKKLRLISVSLLVVSCCLLLMRCASGGGKAVGYVAPPFRNFTLPSEHQTIDPLKGGTVKMKNGTNIEIPANAFVDGSGKPITETVTNIQFESAGMFKIGATTASNTPVAIASGKVLEVNMASNVDGSEFNFYTFDEQKGNWAYIGRKDPVPNEEKKKLLAEAPECEEPVTPQVARQSEPVFDLNIDYTLYPEFKTFEQTLWQCAPTCTETEKKNMVSYLNQNFENIKLESANAAQGTYKLTVYNSGNSYSADVCPVVKEKDMAEARASYAKKFSAYQEARKAQKQAVANAGLLSNLYRSFGVASFGIYNWDSQMKAPGVVKCDLNCKFDSDVNPRELTYYMMSTEEKKVVCYGYYDLHSRVTLNPEMNNRILVVAGGTKLMMATINRNDANVVESRKAECYFKTVPLTINSVEDLDGFIQSL
jgi:hypothetical protein